MGKEKQDGIGCRAKKRQCEDSWADGRLAPVCWNVDAKGWPAKSSLETDQLFIMFQMARSQPLQSSRPIR